MKDWKKWPQQSLYIIEKFQSLFVGQELELILFCEEGKGPLWPIKIPYGPFFSAWKSMA